MKLLFKFFQNIYNLIIKKYDIIIINNIAIKK